MQRISVTATVSGSGETIPSFSCCEHAVQWRLFTPAGAGWQPSAFLFLCCWALNLSISIFVHVRDFHLVGATSDAICWSPSRLTMFLRLCGAKTDTSCCWLFQTALLFFYLCKFFSRHSYNYLGVLSYSFDEVLFPLENDFVHD